MNHNKGMDGTMVTKPSSVRTFRNLDNSFHRIFRFFSLSFRMLRYVCFKTYINPLVNGQFGDKHYKVQEPRNNHFESKNVTRPV